VTGRWSVGCYIWYYEEGTGRGPSTASVPTSHYSMWHYNYLCLRLCCGDCMRRSKNIGDAAVGHASDARQRVDAVLLRLLHLRHRRRPAVVRTTAQPLLPRLTGQRLGQRVSLVSLFSVALCLQREITRSSAVAERPRDVHVIECFAKSLKTTQGHSKWHPWVGRV